MILLNRNMSIFHFSQQGCDLMQLLSQAKTDKKIYQGTLLTLGLSMLTPEYIAPFFIFVLYIMFMKTFKSTERNAKLGTMGKVFFAYTVYMLASAIWSSEHLMSALIALLWMGCFLGYILIANIINTKEKLSQAIYAVSISTGIIGFIGVIEIATYNMSKYFEWFNFQFPNPLYWHINNFFFNLLPIDVINYIFASRASATFDNPLILATYLALATPFCAYASVHFDKSKERKIARICLLFAIGGLICTGSRSSYIGIGLSLLVLLFSNKKVFKKLFPFVIILAIAVPVGLFLRYRNTSSIDFSESTKNRFYIWQSCWDLFTKHPILGLGAGTEPIHQELITTYGVYNRSHAHNLFLEMLTEGGIIGFLFVCSLIFIIVKNIVTICKLKNKEYRKYGMLYISSLIGFLTMSMTEFTLQSAKELMILFFVLGFTEATYRIVTNRQQLASDEAITYEIVEEETEEKISINK